MTDLMDSASSDSDAEGPVGGKRSTFVLNDAFSFDDGGGAFGTEPLHAWNFSKLRSGADPQQGKHSTTVQQKVDKLLKRKEMRQHNLAAAERSRQQRT